MKGFIIALTALAVLLLGAWSLDGRLPPQSTELPTEPEIAGSVEEIAGTWYAYPAGLLIRFNDDGSAQFGLDGDGTVIGYKATVRFEGQELSIRFTNYDDQSEECASAVGRYTVHLRQNGGISFAPLHDDCQLRSTSLSGPVEADFNLTYHPVQD